MKTSRRKFLKISSASAGSMLLPVSLPSIFKNDDENLKELKAVPTYCEVCFWKCAAWAYVDKKGDVKKVVGNKFDPHANGKLCPRGTGGVGMYTDPDRLQEPLMRKTIDGKQEFVKVTWNEAFDFIAQKMIDIKKEHGAESVALFNHGSGGKHFSTLVRAFGSENITAPSYAQCKGPREEAFKATFGQSVGSPEPTDVKNAKCIVFIGNHVGENMHNSFVQEVAEIQDKGASIITVDPRLSTIAAHSTHWLPIKAATDNALLLAWIHELIYRDLYDKEYIEKYATGFEELKEYVKDFTPAWAAKITDLDEDQIKKTAWEMAVNAPATIVHPGRHVTWYGDDTDRLRAVAILNALLGSYGRKGGFYLPNKGSIPSYPIPGFPKPEWNFKEFTKDRFQYAHYSVANTFIDASHPDNKSDKKLKAWFVVGTNLITTIPNEKRTIEAIENLDLLVAVDTMPAEICSYADVILPECTYLERYDPPRVSPHRNANVAFRIPASKPKHLTKPASWMVEKLSKRLGLKAYFPYEDYGEIIDWQLKQIGSSLNDIKRRGILLQNDKNHDLYIKDGEDYKFATESGKIELYAHSLEKKGFAPLPRYVENEQAKEGYYRLNYGRAPMHTFGRTTNNPMLTELMDQNKLWVNSITAKKHKLDNGQEIWLENQDGVVSKFPIKIRVTERIRPDMVYMIHGFGRNNKMLKNSFGKGINDTELITNVKFDPVLGSTGMRSNFVKFLKDEPVKTEMS
jgi:thiosulfate reductase / polysulfide reductase chain A